MKGPVYDWKTENVCVKQPLGLWLKTEVNERSNVYWREEDESFKLDKKR